jgi:hypothetical protein
MDPLFSNLEVPFRLGRIFLPREFQLYPDQTTPTATNRTDLCNSVKILSLSHCLSPSQNMPQNQQDYWKWTARINREQIYLYLQELNICNKLSYKTKKRNRVVPDSSWELLEVWSFTGVFERWEFPLRRKLWDSIYVYESIFSPWCKFRRKNGESP